MKFRFSRLIPVAALLAGMSVLGQTNSAKAGFQVRITDVTTSASQTYNWMGAIVAGQETIIVSDTVGNFTVGLEFAQSNTPGGPSLATLSQSGNSIVNNGADGEQIKIEVTSTDYTAPVTPPPVAFASAVSGTILAGGTISGVTFNSYIGNTNGMYELGVAAPTLGPLSMTGPSGSLSGRNSTNTPLVSSPFSLTNVLLATFTSGAVATNLSGNTTLTPTPEPGTLVMAFTSLGLFGVGRWASRRNKKA